MVSHDRMSRRIEQHSEINPSIPSDFQCFRKSSRLIDKKQSGRFVNRSCLSCRVTNRQQFFRNVKNYLINQDQRLIERLKKLE